MFDREKRSNSKDKTLYTLPLNSHRCTELSSVGAKASRLAEMSLSGYPVPQGFAVTSRAFIDFCTYNKLTGLIDKPSCVDLQKAIMEGSFPETIQIEIDQAFNSLPFEDFAVRSSSIAEDGMDHSMAGQFKTFLGIKKASVPEKIKECWASMFSPSVTAYIQKNNLAAAHRMGVVVQQQKSPDFAGVVFTMDPLTKSTDHIIIEWVDGLGDKLVSGEVTPERIYINRLSQAVPRHPGLPDHFIRFMQELVSYSLKAEKHFRHPVDIEWCMDASGLSILQARPITGLTGDHISAWTNVNMAENFPHAVTPFTWSIVDNFYKYYIRNMLRLFGWKDKKLLKARYIVDNFTGVHGGRIYYNLSNWYEGAYFLPIGDLLRKLLDSFLGQNVPYSFKPGISNQWVSRGWRKPLDYILFLGYMLRMHMTADLHLDNYEKKFYQNRDEWRKQPYDTLPLEDLLSVLNDLFTNFVDKYYYNPGIVDILAAIFPGGLKLLCHQWLSSSESNTDLLAVQLMQGIDVRSTKPSAMIGTMSEKVKERADLQQFLVHKNYQELESNLDNEMKQLLDDFMYNFGGRCYNDCTIITPTFEERHDLFWDLVEKYQRAADREEGGKHADKAENTAHQSHEVVKKLPFLKRLAFRFVLKNAHRAIRLREQSRIIRSLLFGEIRQMALAMGKKLVAKGHLSDAKDVFYLQYSEIEDLAFGKFLFPETLKEIIDLRKEALDRNNSVTPPSFFIREKGRYYEFHREQHKSISQESSILAGIAVSGGSLKARARIILDPVNDNRLEPGDILVTSTTDPGWTPLFRIAGGLILEKGGMLSHGAIVAREFGIPAVAGIEDATKVIPDGSMVFINGDTGEIEILD